MELLIAVAVFAVCAAVCAAIFVNAPMTANEATDLNHALIAARNGAEVLRTTDCLEETAAILGGYSFGADRAVVFFDNNWRATYESNASFILSLASTDASPSLRELSIHNISGEEIISFSVASGRRSLT
jgi:type II secretory pathway pseudopilin PulG